MARTRKELIFTPANARIAGWKATYFEWRKRSLTLTRSFFYTQNMTGETIGAHTRDYKRGEATSYGYNDRYTN